MRWGGGGGVSRKGNGGGIGGEGVRLGGGSVWGEGVGGGRVIRLEVKIRP
jgi:hypothetical protein